MVAGSFLLSGCIANPFRDTKIDPASPVAADVAKLTRQPGKSPGFASIPKAPDDIRPLPQYGVDAQTVLAQGEALTRATAAGTWTLQGTGDFAAKARSDAGPQIEPPKPGDADAFARALRERATPPPRR
ncbi:MAG TPA: hypothetical protein VF474_06720 [Phenylobacterium sp.]